MAPIFIPGDQPPQPKKELKIMAEHETERLRRIEDKLDTLTDVVVSLARAEENLVQQSRDIKRLDEKVDGVEKKAAAALEKADGAEKNISTWINRGMGLWGGAMLIWTFLNSSVFKEILHK